MRIARFRAARIAEPSFLGESSSLSSIADVAIDKQMAFAA
jgi:hypothetical protein